MTVLETWKANLTYSKAHFNPSDYMDISVLETEKNLADAKVAKKLFTFHGANFTDVQGFGAVRICMSLKW